MKTHILLKSNGDIVTVHSVHSKDRIEEKYTRYINCETDILDLTLEEAKFILETDERRNYVTSILQEAGKVILSDYKRVLKENEILKYKYNKALSDVIAGVDLDNTYISKQKVKDKIEELEKAYENSKDENGESIYYYPDYAINILQELIEESEGK